MRTPAPMLIVASAAIALSPTAPGTVLIFQPATGSFSDFQTLPQGYGNRVVSTSQDGFLYGLGAGPTPNVVTQYGTDAMAPLFAWGGEYGDLQNVVFAQEPRPFEMRLVADPGYVVTLASFDMAAWPLLDYTINSVSVLDGSGNTLYHATNVHIEGDASGPAHSHFDFTGLNFTASEIRIVFDSTNVDSDDVGIDNITFSQNAGCPADFDGDGTADFFDYDAFVICFEGGDCPPGKTADFDGDGSVDFFDYDAFVVAFEAGC